MAAAPPPPDPAVLPDELVEECLLRLPPEDPADLARAALVSRQWHRVVTGAGFRRRYIEFHRSAPLLGYILQLQDSIRFVPMSSSFRSPRAHRRRDVRVVQSSHGWILLYATVDQDLEFGELGDLYLFVWDPITDKEWELPMLASIHDPDRPNWDSALVCSHLDCHFKVVIVGISKGRMFSCFYSSEAGSWSDIFFVSRVGFGSFLLGSVLVGNTLYFGMEISSHVGAITIVEYDLPTHQVCMISLQCDVELGCGGHLIATEDGRLGVAMTSNSTLRLWLREQGRLTESRVIQFGALLPDDALHHPLFPREAVIFKPWVSAFAQIGAGVIFLWTCVGYFTIDLNSGRSKELGEYPGSSYVVPYVSFCTPAPGTVSTDEGPGASVVSTDEPTAGVAVSTDEGPGDVVVVSTDEGPGDVVVVSADEGPGDDVVVSTDERPGSSLSCA